MLIWASSFAVIHVIFRVREWMSISRGSEPADAGETLMTGFNVIFSLLCVFGASLPIFVGVLELPTGTWPALALFSVMTIACTISFIVMFRRGRAERRGELDFVKTADYLFRLGLRKLSAADRNAIRDDIAASINALVSAGIVSEHDQRILRPKDIGSLSTLDETFGLELDRVNSSRRERRRRERIRLTGSAKR
jgi:hypothetical protein